MKLCVLLALQLWIICDKSTQSSLSVSTVTPNSISSHSPVSSSTVKALSTVSDTTTSVLSTTPSTLTVSPVPSPSGSVTIETVRFSTPSTSIPVSLTDDSVGMVTSFILQSVNGAATTSRSAPVTTQSPEPPTTESPTSFIEFVMDNPVAFSIVGASIAFIVFMLCCLCIVLICRKRLINRRQRRRDKILDEAGDVWIVNRHATDSPGPHAMEAQHRTAATVLQMSPQDDHRNLVLSNAPASQSSLLQYHEMPDLVGSPRLPTLSPMTSSASLMRSPNTSTSQLMPPTAQSIVPMPSAPPPHHIHH